MTQKFCGADRVKKRGDYRLRARGGNRAERRIPKPEPRQAMRRLGDSRGDEAKRKLRARRRRQGECPVFAMQSGWAGGKRRRFFLKIRRSLRSKAKSLRPFGTQAFRPKPRPGVARARQTARKPSASSPFGDLRLRRQRRSKRSEVAY